MPQGVVIAVAVTGGVLALLTVLHIVFTLVRNRMRKAILERFRIEDIVRADPGANFFGQQSKGMGQIRGNGALVLTADELYFVLAVPRREFSIPVSKIVEVTTPRSFLGKSILRPLLCVAYETGGERDAIAWALRDVPGWQTAIENQRAARPGGGA